tara:strand:- start:205 stop:408 length:204 start_codon:yes stop_codon:yes gene_type:complete
MAPKKQLRNARIVRIRDSYTDTRRNGVWMKGNTMSWADIAARIAREFPEDAVSRQRCWEIYKEETKK